MAHASNKHFGAGGQRGKGDGSGAASMRPVDLPENAVLSNRDKKQSAGDRGRDGQWISQQQHFETDSAQRKD